MFAAMKRSAPALLAVTGAVTLASVALAASPTHVGVDHVHSVRFSLTARALTVTLEPVSGQPNPLIDEIPGTTLDTACSGRNPSSGKKVLASKLSIKWPKGADSKTFTLNKDVSAHVQWCVLEYESSGIDIALSEKMRVPNPAAAPTQ
jgi:hypothetical protein